MPTKPGESACGEMGPGKLLDPEEIPYFMDLFFAGLEEGEAGAA